MSDEWNRPSVSARLSYIDDADARKTGKHWCVEVSYSDWEPEFQGWAPDPLGAALAAAEVAYFEYLKTQPPAGAALSSREGQETP